MAKIILSALLDDLRGKLGGSVFQGTVGGLQMRTRVSPRDPKSEVMQLRRSKFGYASHRWPLLTTPQRATWDVELFPNVQGIALYKASNAKINTAGSPLLDSYTSTVEFLTPVVSIVDLEPNLFTFTTDYPGGVLDADDSMSVFVTPLLSPGQSFISPSRYVYLKTYSPGTDIGVDLDITAEYQAKYGVITSMSLVGIKIYYVQLLKGAYSLDSLDQAYAA